MTFPQGTEASGMGASRGWDMMSELKVRKSLWGCMRITWQPRRGQMGRFERELMRPPPQGILPVYHSLLCL